MERARATSLTGEGSPAHNFLVHPEVNFNVFLALRGTHFEHLINYDIVRQSQDERWFWRSYFYPSLLFATLLALDLLRGNPAFAAAIEQALVFIVGSQNADGSLGADSDPYETALAVAALAGYPARAEALRRGVEHLLSTPSVGRFLDVARMPLGIPFGRARRLARFR